MRFLICFFSSVWFISAYAQNESGFDLFYCENTLSPSCISVIDSGPVLIEIPLNANAVISKLPLFYVLQPDVSLINISTLPVNFSSTQSYTFKIKKGDIEREVIMKARQIKNRSGMFNVSFANNYKPSDWSLYTTGWMAVGIDQDATDIFLNNNNAVFFMSGDGNQNFIAFDLIDDGFNYDGVLIVEGSTNGVDNWDPVYVLDFCSDMYIVKGQTIRLKLQDATRYVRITFQKNQAASFGIHLNNFQLKLYDGGDYDNRTNVKTVVENYEVQLKSTVVKQEIQILNINGFSDRNYAIYSAEGVLCQKGKIQNSIISASKLRPGIYILKINGLMKGVKFIKNN